MGGDGNAGCVSVGLEAALRDDGTGFVGGVASYRHRLTDPASRFTLNAAADVRGGVSNEGAGWRGAIEGWAGLEGRW